MSTLQGFLNAAPEKPHYEDVAEAEYEALRKDAERYRMLRDNGYLDNLLGDVHPCDEPRRMELTDKKVDQFSAIHARPAVGAA